MIRVIKVLFWTIIDLVFLPVHYLPGHIGSRILRPLLWKFRLKKLGRGCRIDVGVHFVSPECISIGDNTWIDKDVLLLAGKPTVRRKTHYRPNRSFRGKEGELYIGQNCHIAPYVIISARGGVWIGDNVGIATGTKVYSLAHHYRNPSDEGDHFLYKYTPMAPQDEQVMISGPVVIEDNAGLTLDVIVFAGVTIGQYSLVGPQSVVTKDVPPYVIAAGNPCEIIKRRKVGGEAN